MANKGPLYGLSKDCKMKTEQKFCSSQAVAVVQWMEAVLGRQLHPDLKSLTSERDFAGILKDGVALCELMNAINPGAIKRFNKQPSTFQQMENLELFTKACLSYGLKQIDLFQITDLYDVKATYTVFNCLHALGSQAQKNGFTGPCFGVKISDKRDCTFTNSQIVEGRRIIPMQAGTSNVPSQSGMSPYGFSRQIVPTDKESTILLPASTRVISLQYGTNITASQKGMTPYGLGRQIISSNSLPLPEELFLNGDLDKSESEAEVQESEITSCTNIDGEAFEAGTLVDDSDNKNGW